MTKESSRHHSRDGGSRQGGRARRDDRVEERMGKDELLLPLINCFVYCRFLFASALTRARRMCSCSPCGSKLNTADLNICNLNFLYFRKFYDMSELS